MKAFSGGNKKEMPGAVTGRGLGPGDGVPVVGEAKGLCENCENFTRGVFLV